jgi:small-conductance mechanosensitive channel
MGERAAALLKSAPEYAVPLGVFLGVVIVGLILRSIIVRRLTAWSKRTATRLDDIVISSISAPMVIWFIMLGLYAALEISAVPERIVHVVEKVLLVLVIFSITLALANLLSRLVGSYGARGEGARSVTSLTQNVMRILVFMIGILVILNALGVSITPMLATLGVGGLAVALALQDTLANLFAGIHINLARQIRVGDYVRIDSGEEGYVADIGWRATRVRMLSNNIILVPNDKLAKSIVTNYHLPGQDLAVLVDVGVHYGTDLVRAEAVAIEVAREVMREVKGGVPEFEPFIRYNKFGDSSINFTAILRAREFTDQYLVKHEFIKRLNARFAKEGIVIPFPIRAINYEQEKRA